MCFAYTYVWVLCARLVPTEPGGGHSDPLDWITGGCELPDAETGK